MANDTPVSSIA